MKVALDISRMNKLSLTRGIGVYASNLLQAIKNYSDVEIDLVEIKVNYEKYDLIHFPFFDIFNHSLPLNMSQPAVVTIHDLIPIQFPKHYPSGIKGKINWQLQKLAINKIKKIIAVSETVKNDIVELLKINGNKISVVYSAPSKNFKKIMDINLLENIRKKYNLPKEFVLYIGNVNWNKNILNITEGVMKAKKELVIVGGSFLDKTNLNHPEKKAFQEWLDKYGNRKEIFTLGFVEKKDIVLILNEAKVLMFASFYEGFGLPILEAQSCKIPVITSVNGGATAEIAGKGAILIDPENVDEMANAVNGLFSDTKLSKKIIDLGSENLERFSWQKTVTQTLKVYEDALS